MGKSSSNKMLPFESPVCDTSVLESERHLIRLLMAEPSVKTVRRVRIWGIILGTLLNFLTGWRSLDDTRYSTVWI